MRFKHILIEIVYVHISNSRWFQLLTRLKEKIIFTRFDIKRFNDQIKSSLKLVADINGFFYRLNASLKQSNARNQHRDRSLNLARFLLYNFGSFFNLLSNIKRSLRAICNAFSFNLMRLIQLPQKLRASIRNCLQGVGEFWLQIEQIIQIAKLPIELLYVIGKFLGGLKAFLEQIERPNIR
jgi:hypothetical protein